MRIAVIGIDRYRACGPLRNAVRDAQGVREVFEERGFECVAELLDDHATGDALRDLVTVDLKASLAVSDSLVLFFAGHGRTVPRPFRDGGPPVPGKGYLLPVDAGERPRTWLELRSWLSDVAELPALHILVILDSCHSGIALDIDSHARDSGPTADPRLDPLQVRRSRRVITSALGDQCAMDSGPVAGHSLFAGCLIDAIRRGMSRQARKFVAGSYLGTYVQDRVRQQADVPQTPGIGTLEFHAHGELLVPIGRVVRRARPAVGSTVATRQDHQPARGVAEPRPGLEAARDHQLPGAVQHSEGWTLDPGFIAALDRHCAERAHGSHVLSLVQGDPMATLTAWATWAADYGFLTLTTEGHDRDAAVADLLGQLPWMRCLSESRRRLAAAAGLEVEAIDAALDARSAGDRSLWIDDIAGLDGHARVGGWLLCALRESTAQIPDPSAAPLQGGDLLAIACDLACPTAVLVHHSAPDAAWLEHAIATAAALTTYLPRQPVAIAAPEQLVTTALRGARHTAALSMARQGQVRVIAMAGPPQRSPGRGRYRTARVLFEALSRDPRTRGRFELAAEVSLSADGPAIDVDLVAARARVAVMLDAWHHFYDPVGYRRDRIQDLRLQRAGYFVLRFLAEDVDQRLAATLDQIALALGARRRAQGGLS